MIFPNLKIGIIIPAYNEEENIGRVLSEIPKNFSDLTQIIIVDDGSNDKTARIARNFNCIILQHQENYGYGAAIRTGINYVKRRKFDITILLDADGQHNPNYILKFIEAILKRDIDFVIGNRFDNYFEMSTLRKFTSKILSVLYLILFKKYVIDPTNGYRAIKYKVLKDLNLECDYSVSQEMLYKIIPYYNFEQIPIKVNKRNKGTSFISIKEYFPKFFTLIIKYLLFSLRNI